MKSWSEEEIAALIALAAGGRVRKHELDRFIAKYPGHGRAAVCAKIEYLRRTGRARDATLPAYRRGRRASRYLALGRQPL